MSRLTYLTSWWVCQHTSYDNVHYADVVLTLRAYYTSVQMKVSVPVCLDCLLPVHYWSTKLCVKVKKVKGRDIYIPTLTGKPRPAAVYNSKWHTDRQWHKWRRTPVAQPAALWPSPRNVLLQRLTIFSSKCYQILIATHLATPGDGRLSRPCWLTDRGRFTHKVVTRHAAVSWALSLTRLSSTIASVPISS